MNAPGRGPLPFVDLKAQYAALSESIDARIRKVLDHAQFIMGPEVAELEEKLAARTGAKHCVTCASGTEALLIALMALGVKPGDEVITTPFTFVATAEMIVLLGAKPVFVDVEPDTCNIDAAKIAAAVTPRTRAILPVALYGQPADMDEINEAAARRGLPVIEDAAQSFGATYKGRPSCNLSTIGCTSFFPSKPLGCYGDGGALFTSDDALAAAMREIRVHGQSGRYRHTRVGLGGRMDREIERRAAIGRRYEALLAERAPDLDLLEVRPDRTSAYAQFTVRVGERERVVEKLRAAGVPSAVHYPAPIHLQPAYAGTARPGSLRAAEAAAREVLSVPMHADLDDAVQERVVAALAAAIAG